MRLLTTLLLAAAQRTNAWGNHTCKKPIKRRGKQTTHNDERWRTAACAHATARRFANEEAVAAALRGAGC